MSRDRHSLFRIPGSGNDSHFDCKVDGKGVIQRGPRQRGEKTDARVNPTLAFPALLGIQDPLRVKKDLEEIIGVEVFEIPILPPSIPGMRIFRHFKEWLIQRGVTFLLGHSVLKANLNAKRCERIEVSHPPLSQSYSADRFILATGRFIGGGLKADEENIFEPLFNLPVLQPGSRDNWFANSFFNSHPIHQAGILTDSSFRPVDEKGEQLLDNVWIAGSILAGHDCIQEKSREGVEIATGYWAAKCMRLNGQSNAVKFQEFRICRIEWLKSKNHELDKSSDLHCSRV